MEINRLFEKYYALHQMSKTVNLLDIAMSGKVPDTMNITKCICTAMQPKEGWAKNVERTSSDDDRCYYCRLQLSEIYPDFLDGYQKKDCKHCYKFMAKKYVSSGDVVLTKSYVRKHKPK